jgi:hypothetical protein
MFAIGLRLAVPFSLPCSAKAPLLFFFCEFFADFPLRAAHSNG